ncbi:MAG TPA: type II secretion system F family protein [Methanomassiliicoccales archaeon]|nr:type II secretion system F family protein [Methanomassiliicoccales archaeon]
MSDRTGIRRKAALVFRQMDMRLSTYFLLVFLSVVVFGLIVPAAVVLNFGANLPFTLQIVLYSVPILVIFVVSALPLILVGKKKKNIEYLMPLFVTRMAALSTSDLPTDRIFYILSTRKEYGQLAEDAKKIFHLISDYHQPASEACRFIAARTPSIQEADFFNRLSHSLDVGERLERFLRNEQDVIMDEYVLKCEATIKDMDFVKEIYTAIITSMIFLIVFITIVPLMGPNAIDLLVFGITAAFGVMEVLFLVFVLMRLPKDDIWYHWRIKWKEGYVTSKDKTLFAAVIVAIAGIILLVYLLLPLNLPTAFYVATIFMPVLIPGIIVFREEKAIVRRDNIYGAFIRALGRSSDVSGETMTQAVKRLAMHKFGPLTKLIKNLEKRLSTRISTMDAWRHFSSEASSNLINKFGEMYIHSTLNGSKPEPTSIFISNNMGKILAVRKKRDVLAGSFVGVLYGVMVATGFTLFITVGIVEYMGHMINALIVPGQDFVQLGILTSIFSASFNVEMLRTMVYFLIVVHAAASAVMLTILKGGHIVGAGVHFLIMIWIGMATAYLAEAALGGLLVS